MRDLSSMYIKSYNFKYSLLLPSLGMDQDVYPSLPVLKVHPEEFLRAAVAGSLRKLELNGNALTALPVGMGALTALTQLALQGNQLTALPEELSSLQV